MGEHRNDPKRLVLAIGLCLCLCAGLAFLLQQFSP